MGIKEFLKQVNDIADKEHTKPSFDKSLSGVHIYNKEKVCKCERIFDGTVIDIEGNKKKTFPYGYAASFNKNYIAGQKAYEEKGEFSKSLAFYKSARSLQDSIYSIENNKKFS